MVTMTSLLWPGAIAILIAWLALMVGGIFLLAIQYRRHGRLSWRRTITTMSAVLYGFGLFSYTMLPLPESSNAFCRPGVAVPQFTPLHFIGDFQEAYALGARSFLTSFTLWQVLFNIILFMPLGVLVVRWMRGNILSATLLGGAVSLLIELSQLTGLWGIYECPYRVADADDLLMNTFGAFLGAIIAYLPMFAWLTGPVEARAEQAPPRVVTRSRRIMADVFDLAFFSAAVLAAGFGLQLVATLGGPTAPGYVVDDLVPIAAITLTYMLPTLSAGRASLGQRCAWIQVVAADSAPAPFWRAGLRALLGFGGLSLIYELAGDTEATGPLDFMLFPVLMFGVISAVTLVLDRSGRGLAARITGTGFIDRRANLPQWAGAPAQRDGAHH